MTAPSPLLLGHRWISVEGGAPRRPLQVLVDDDGNRPVLVWYPADADDIPRPPDLDMAGVQEATGWGCAIARLWSPIKGGFLWIVTCRSKLWTGVSIREEQRSGAYHDESRGRARDESVSLVSDASGLRAYSTSMVLAKDHRGCRRGATAVWTFANGGGCLAIGETCSVEHLLGVFIGQAWAGPGTESS